MYNKQVCNTACIWNLSKCRP